MPLSYNIAEQEQQAVITGDGAVTMAGMIAFVQQVAADPQFHPHYTVILDLHKADTRRTSRTARDWRRR